MLIFENKKDVLARNAKFTYRQQKTRRARYKLGWKKENARYYHHVREIIKIKRLAFCIKALNEKEGFEDVIITEETIGPKLKSILDLF